MIASRRGRRPWIRSVLAPLALIVALAAAVLVRPGDEPGALQLANPDLARVAELRAVVAALPDAPLVLVGLDPDLGTYAEIRTTVRTALDDLLAEGARLAFVSFTPEGRAVASAELDRLERGRFDENRLLDIGFIAGAEAGMVRAVTDLLPRAASGPVAAAIAEADGGMAAFDLALVVGGGELGPRTWIEQVATRLPELTIVAIAPSFAQPELAPYLRTGQLAALLATLRDGAAYVADGGAPDLDAAPGERVPSALAMLLGMVVALGVLGRSATAGLRGGPGGQAEAAAAASAVAPRPAAERTGEGNRPTGTAGEGGADSSVDADDPAGPGDDAGEETGR